jgi:peptide/nickel transport system substrate-binding protein
MSTTNRGFLRGGVMAALSLLGSGAVLGLPGVGHAAPPSPQRGGTVIAALANDPPTLNPDITTGAPDGLLGCMIYEAMLRFGPGFKVEPNLAKSWEISPDGLTYTFHLVSANWQDGQPFTSDDVKYTLTEVSGKYGPFFAAASKAIKSVDTPDPHTVVIHLVRPFGPMLFSLTCEQNAAILPAHLLRGKDVLTSPVTLNAPVGTGAFKLGEWVRGDHITLERNPTYWREGEPYLDRIIAKFIPEPTSRVLGMQAGEVDFIDEYYLPLSAYQMIAHDPRFQLHEIGYPDDDLIILNTKHAPLDKREVRQALMIGLDRDYLLKNVFFGIGQAGMGPIDSRMTWAYDPKINYEKMYAYDPARARAMLDAAGLKPNANGTRFTLNLVFDSTKPDYVQLAEAVKRFWGDIGVNVVLKGSERSVELKQVYSDYDFDATLQNYTTAGDPALGIARLYVTDSIKRGSTFNNASQYSNPEVDELFNKGRDAANEEERAKYYFEVQPILARDLPTLVIHQQAEIDAASKRLDNLWTAPNVLRWETVSMEK